MKPTEKEIEAAMREYWSDPHRNMQEAVIAALTAAYAVREGEDSVETLQQRIKRMGYRIQELEFKLLPTNCKPTCRGYVYKGQKKTPCNRTSEFDKPFCYSHRNQVWEKPND